MNPLLFPSSCLFFMIIIFSQIPTFSCVENEQYTNCGKAFQCADKSNLVYPFWGGSSPDYCGHPSFGLNYISSQDLMLYYGCARLPTTIPGQFDCSVDGTTNTLGFPTFVSNMTLVTSCHIGVSVRVDQTEATAFASNPTSVTVTQVLDSGVELQWDANNSFCDQCIGSGGKCGSDTSSRSFACYCSDKPYAFTKN